MMGFAELVFEKVRTLFHRIYPEFIEGFFARAKNNSDELCSVGKNIGSDYFLTNRQLGVRYKMGFAELAVRGDSLSEPIYNIARTYFTKNY